MKETLTPAQIAEELGVTSVTVRNWIEAGKLRGFRIGGRLFVRRADLDQFLAMPVYPKQEKCGGGVTSGQPS